jgi:stearoyl-CoA desaturase (delta-9 desaturase)
VTPPLEPGQRPPINWIGTIPIWVIHALPFLAFLTGVPWWNWVLLGATYWGRMFFITAGYHRYFAHRSFKTNRVFQFILAFGAGTAAQKGPLWWAGNHRLHHRYSDTPRDPHTPIKGFWWSHIGWILCSEHDETPMEAIEDFAAYPELRFLNKHDWIAPWSLGLACALIGGWSGLLIGFFLSTVLLWHSTFMVNSVVHVVGTRRYATNDTSRNNAAVAFLTMGEGWHNNHHYYPSSARQGFAWWEFDASWYVLRALAVVHLVTDLKEPSAEVRKANRIRQGNLDIGMLREQLRQARVVVDDSRVPVLDLCDPELDGAKTTLEEALHNMTESAERVARLDRKRRRQIARDALAAAAAESPSS